jgi:CHAD domain-containing protein
MEKILLDYCLLQHRNIGHYLNLCVERAEAESVHQLRVSIKKFRAVSKLLEYLMPESSCDNREQLLKQRSLFKLAGSLRDSQVQMILFKYYETELKINVLNFEYVLKRAEQSALRKFNSGFTSFGKLLADRPFPRLDNKSLNNIPDVSFRTRASKLLDKRMKKLRKAIGAIDSDATLHNVRIQLKQIRYMLSVLSEQDNYFEKYTIDMAGLRTTEIQLGRWHDLTVFRETIMKYIDRKQQKSNARLQDILTLNGAVAIDIEVFRQQILESFRQLKG